MVDVRVRPVADVLDPQLPGIRSSGPQREPDGHGEDGHRLIVGVGDGGVVDLPWWTVA